MLDHSCQVQRHPLSERGDDLYETDPVAVEALLRVEKIPQRIWEPACGPGAIVRPFKLVEPFVAHAIEICPRVIMLLRWAFYESDRRTEILEGCGLARG